MARSTGTFRAPPLQVYVIMHARAIENPLENSECTICFCAIVASENGMLMEPCNHLFHSACIRSWFENQFLASHRRSVSCPNCRITFCTADHLRERSIITSCKALDILGEPDPKFLQTKREAERRMRLAGKVTEEIISWAIREWSKIDPNVEREYRGTHFLRENRSRDAGAHVDVNAETDQPVVRQMVQMELSALDVTIIQAIATERLRAEDARDEPNWIPAIDWAWDFWRECGYPRTNYITHESSHQLTICAGLVYHLSSLPRFNNTSSFAQLLAHGDALLLRAQQDARLPAQPPEWYVEHNRLLNHADVPPAHDSTNSGDDFRKRYIVGLRMRTRGAGADPLGPVPQHT